MFNTYENIKSIQDYRKILGIFDAFKKTKRQIIRDNQQQGKSGEDTIRRDLEFSGYKVERTGRGHDLKAKRKDWLTGKNETKYIEVKTGNSPLSKLQKKKKRRMGSKYVVKRLEPTPLGFIPATDKKNKSSNKSKFDALFGSNSKSKKKSSAYTALLGSSTTKSRKKKNNSIDSIFGSKSSGKKKKSRSSYDNIWGTPSTKKRRTRSTSNNIWGSKPSRKSKKSSIW